MDAEVAHILVLEDDSTLREILEELLEDEGYRVTSAASSAGALEQVTQEDFDLLLFDIRMEGMDGLEALQRMRQRGHRFPSLAMTGFAGDDDPVRALKLGVGDYLRKPFQPEELLESVANLLSRHRQLRQTETSLAHVRQLALWASRVLAPDSGLPRRIDGLAEAMELMPAQAAELVLAGLVWAQKPDSFEAAEAPQRIAPWGRFLNSPTFAQPLEAQILGLAQASLEVEPEARMAEVIIGRHPGIFDPMLVAALDRLGAPSSQDSRRWLGLAQGLLAQGKKESAKEALEKVVGLTQGQPAVQACLSLADLSFGQPQTVAAWVRKGLELARQLGPMAAARAAQWGALLLRKSELPEAEAALREALGSLSALGLKAEAAIVELALGSTRPELLELLLRPEHEPQLAAELDFLFPHLCRTAPARYLRRLLLRYPWLARHPLLPAELQAAPEESQPVLRIVSFGGLQIYWGGSPIAEDVWRGPLVKYLFAFLARTARPIPENQILEAFWPDGHENSKRRLSGALSSIRRALNLATGLSLDPVVRSRNFYALHEELQVWYDLREFTEAQAQCDWARMQVLYQGPYLEGCYLEWAVTERGRLEDQWVQALLQMAGATLEKHPEQALEAVQKAVAIDPLQPAVQVMLLKAYLKLGQPERAVREYERLRQLLRHEMGLEPSLELMECYHRARLALP